MREIKRKQLMKKAAESVVSSLKEKLKDPTRLFKLLTDKDIEYLRGLIESEVEAAYLEGCIDIRAEWIKHIEENRDV